MQHRRREPVEGIFRLVLPLPFPGLDRVNAYLLADEAGATLVDCGIYFPDEGADHGWDELVAALDACGTRPDEIRRLVLTHTHIDHYGMAGRVREVTGCEVIFHRAGDGELDILREPERVARDLKRTYADHGVPEDELEELTSYEDWRGFVHSVIPADTWWDGDEILEVGGRTWQAIYTPGHSRSHVCLWSEPEGLLISGDHLLGSITPHIDFRRGEGDPLGDFMASLERIEKLDPDVVLPGHGHPFRNGGERARITLRHHERRLGAILQVVRKKACTADEITDEIFGETLLHFQRRLALGEALAHIHYLRLRGEVERVEAEDGTRLYRKAARKPPPEIDE